MRQAYDYWQDQPGSNPRRTSTRTGQPSKRQPNARRPSFVLSVETLERAAASHKAGCPESFPHPGAQLKDVAHSACSQRRRAGGRRPQLEWSAGHPEGGVGRMFISLGSRCLRGHSVQETTPSPGLSRPWINSLKRIGRGRFTAQAGSPPTRTNQPQLTHRHGSPVEIHPTIRTTMET